MPKINTQAVAICPTCKGFRDPKPLQHSTIYFCPKCGHGEQVNHPSPPAPTNIMETCSPGGNCFDPNGAPESDFEDPILQAIVSEAVSMEDDGPNILQPLHDPIGAAEARQQYSSVTDMVKKVTGDDDFASELKNAIDKKENDIPLWAQLVPPPVYFPNVAGTWPDEPRNVVIDVLKQAKSLGMQRLGHTFIPLKDGDTIAAIKPGSPASFFKSGIPLQIRSHTGAPMPEQMKQHHTGAVRSSDADNVAYHLISPVGLRRIAETYAEGSKKYGDYNWEKGFNVGNTLNHTIRHIFLFLEGDSTEDHLAHAAWNLIAVMHFQERMPHLLQDLRPAAIEAATPKASLQKSVATPSNRDIAEEIQNGLRRGDSIVAPISPPVFDHDLQPGMMRTDLIKKTMTINVPEGFTVVIGDLRIKDRVVYSTNNPNLRVHAETHIDIPKAGS